jgi:hypothetical protein
MYMNLRRIIMFHAFKQLFSMFATLFTAGDHLASAGLHLSRSLDEMAATYEDEQRYLRNKAIEERKAQRAISA